MYGKVFTSLWTGTLYGRSDPQHVFIYLLCNSDLAGFVDVSPPAIAGATGLPLDRVQAALSELESPDPLSRSTELEGRRLERIDPQRPWGWRIVNYDKYRGMRDAQERRKQNREAQARHRSKPQSGSVSQHKPRSSHADAEVDAEVDAEATPGKHLPAKAGECPNFAAFYASYPRKTKRPDAEKAWRQVEAEKHLSAIAAGLARWREVWTDPQYVPYPATWLRARQWNDDPRGVVESQSSRLRRAAQAMREEHANGTG